MFPLSTVLDPLQVCNALENVIWVCILMHIHGVEWRRNCITTKTKLRPNMKFISLSLFRNSLEVCSVQAGLRLTTLLPQHHKWWCAWVLPPYPVSVSSQLFCGSLSRCYKNQSNCFLLVENSSKWVLNQHSALIWVPGLLLL